MTKFGVPFINFGSIIIYDSIIVRFCFRDVKFQSEKTILSGTSVRTFVLASAMK